MGRCTYFKICKYSKICLKKKKIDEAKILITNGSLMQVESIAECSPWSILQYFWPALSDNWSWKPIFGLFESGRLRPVLLYETYNFYLRTHNSCILKEMQVFYQ